MKSIKQICLITIIMICFIIFTTSASGVVYVNKNATGANNGNSWLDAYTTIQAGINDADVGDEEVWVAQGTYLEVIAMKSGVALYGGFNGTETDRSQRNWATNITKIDASTASGGSPASHVIIMVNITNSAIDGFTITGGKANGGGANNYGGGIYCYNLNDTNIIKNNTISGNLAGWNGGGISCNSSSSPEITNNTITGNSADFGDGGGIFCEDNSSPAITNNTISGNWAWGGGGISCWDYSSPEITNNTISGNSANLYGGGILCRDYSSPAITNNTITGNSAGSRGGGIYCRENSDPQIKNTIFSANNKYDIYEDDLNSDPAVTYNDFYGNSDGVYFDEGTTPYATVSAMDSAIAECSNNIGLQPLFVGDTLSGGSWTAAPVYNSATFQTTLTNSFAAWTANEHNGRLLNPDTSQKMQFVIVSNTVTTMTVWGNVTAIAHSGDVYNIFDYHLRSDSPCIDAGCLISGLTEDFEGDPRPINGTIQVRGDGSDYDIGADEYNRSVEVDNWILYE